MKGFKYQVTVKVLLCKYKGNGGKEFATVYFNSATKTIINSHKYGLDKSFQEILYRIENWINEESSWVIESLQSQYVNISVYSSIPGSIYIELLDKLKNPMKGLINIKNNDNKCFLWCHIRHLNSLKIHPERITNNKFSKRVVLYTEKYAVYRFFEAILKEYNYCKKIIKMHFSKILTMSAEEEEKVQLSNSCWICNKLFDAGDDKSKRSLSYKI